MTTKKKLQIKGIRTYLEMKTKVPKKIFASLNVLENYLGDEKWKNVVRKKITQ